MAVHREKNRSGAILKASAVASLCLLLLGVALVIFSGTSQPSADLLGVAHVKTSALLISSDDSDVDGLEKAILNEITRGPDSTTDYSDGRSHHPAGHSRKAKVVPSAMAALLHKALMEQQSEEANQEEALKTGQEDLKEQEAVAKRHAAKRVFENPDLALAQYVEKKEKSLLQASNGASKSLKNQKQTKALKHSQLVKDVVNENRKSVSTTNTADNLQQQESALKKKFSAEMKHQLVEWRESNLSIDQEAEKKLKGISAAEESKIDHIKAQEDRAIAAIEHLKKKQLKHEEAAKKEGKTHLKMAEEQAEIQKEIANVQASMVKRLHDLKAKLTRLDNGPASPLPAAAVAAAVGPMARLADGEGKKPAVAAVAKAADVSEKRGKAAASVDRSEQKLSEKREAVAARSEEGSWGGVRSAVVAQEQAKESGIGLGGSHLSKILKLSRDIGKADEGTELEKLRQIRHEIISDYQVEHYIRHLAARAHPPGLLMICDV